MAAIVVLCVILGATLCVPATSAITVNIKLSVSRGVSSNYLNFRSSFPLTVSLSVNNSLPGATYFWQFGDGTNSSNAAPSHVYDAPCVYDIQVQMTASNGSVTSAGLVMGAFGVGGQSGRSLALCPPQGTAGLIQVELAGGYFTGKQPVNVLMNGTSIGTVTADKAGDWLLNVTGLLAPEPNGTQYAFTTSPISLTAAFTTLEGIRATPGSGAPGTTVQVEGLSYPAYSTVVVFLGGASLGTAVTDGTGSFLATFQIPYASPLTSAGTYPYSTLPAILGSGASFVSSGSLVALFSSWWWWLLLLVILLLIAAYLVRRRMRHRVMPPAQGQSQPTS